MKRLIAWLLLVLALVWIAACELSIAPYQCAVVSDSTGIYPDTILTLDCR